MGSQKKGYKAQSACYISVVAAMAHTETISTERMHSCNRQRAKPHAQTKTIHIKDLATWQSLRTAGP